MCSHLRKDALLPPNALVSSKDAVHVNVQSGVALPSWHCAFKGCDGRASAYEDSNNHDFSHEHYLWNHVHIRHHRVFQSITRKSKLKEFAMKEADVPLTLYNAGLAEKERCSVPELGLCTDRRVMRHVSEVFREDNIKVLMCFSCACREMLCNGYDKFGKKFQKGNISMRSDPKEFGKILCGDEDDAAKTAWSANLSAKRFKFQYGKAVATDPGMQDDCFEWIRKVRRNGQVESILCCPEDVERTSKCRHDATFVCQHCAIPFCNECYTLSCEKKQIPRCLANDNYIGYVHQYIATEKVTWLEASIACPVFSGLVTYYVEGKA